MIAAVRSMINRWRERRKSEEVLISEQLRGQLVNLRKEVVETERMIDDTLADKPTNIWHQDLMKGTYRPPTNFPGHPDG